MSVRFFFDPELVAQLATCGITRQRIAPVAGTGFVAENRRQPAQPRQAVTHTLAVHSGVTITGPRPREQREQREQRALPAPQSTEPQTALQLIEENARLRAEIDRLRAEVARLTPRSDPAEYKDDTVVRFSLLELD